ncbi:MAG: periplasmic heavy metal sensor [Williamsia sp.]|nr:periplasmic heavy metal sensor [Williamsia sp.]
MNKTNLLSVAVIGLLIINLGLLGFFFFHKPLPPPGMLPERGDGPKNIIIEKLHFDKEQVQQYEVLIDQHFTTIAGLEQEIRHTKNKLYATLQTAAPPDKDSLLNRLEALQKQIELVHYNHFTQIRQLCREDQLVYFNALTKDLAAFFTPQKNLPPPPKD